MDDNVHLECIPWCFCVHFLRIILESCFILFYFFFLQHNMMSFDWINCVECFFFHALTIFFAVIKSKKKERNNSKCFFFIIRNGSNFESSGRLVECVYCVVFLL